MTTTNLKSFIEELSGFAKGAEVLLAEPAENTDRFTKFSNYMIAIRGTADQLGFPDLSRIAGLGEEIAVKATHVKSPNQSRKCMSCLWDAVTTIKYLLENPAAEGTPSEEQAILTQRLESVLQSLGGKRESVSPDDIEKLLQGRG
ncbi:MAG: hypothetical protein P4M08_05770 [Oligoflexia bacterium]|nr:hypothetical protein [Oligoflexia bacterium]